MGPSPSKLDPMEAQPILSHRKYPTPGSAEIAEDFLVVDADLAGSYIPAPSAHLALTTTAQSKLFDGLGPAFFSPSPSSRHAVKIWKQCGGTLILSPPALIRSYQHGYLNIPLSAIDDLNEMINTARLIFIMPNDPILHFIRNPYVVMYNTAWVGQCIEEGRLVSVSPYIITKPTGLNNEAEEARSVLERIANIDPATIFDHHTPASHPTPPISKKRPRDAEKSARKRRSKRRSLIIQPYLYLHIPDATIHLPSTTPASYRSPTARSHHQQHLKKDTIIRPAYTLPGIPPRKHTESYRRQISQSPYPICMTSSFNDQPSPPSSPLPMTPLLAARSPSLVDYRLVADLPSSIRMQQHSIDEQNQITMEALEEANTMVGQKLHLWDGKSPLTQQSAGFVMLQEEEEVKQVELRQAEIREEESRQADDESSEAGSELSGLPEEQRDPFEQDTHRPADHTLPKPTMKSLGAIAVRRHPPLRKNTTSRGRPVPVSSRMRMSSVNLPISGCTRKQKAERRQARAEISVHQQDRINRPRPRPEIIKEETLAPISERKLIFKTHESDLSRANVIHPMDRQRTDKNGHQAVKKRKRNEQDENLPYRPTDPTVQKKEEDPGMVGKDYRKAKKFRA